jgi:hypothetical protein
VTTSNPRRKRKTPHSGSGVLKGFHFSDADWELFESKLGQIITADQRERLRRAAIDFRLDWEAETTWPEIDPTIRKLKDVEKAAHMLFTLTLPNRLGLEAISIAAQTTPEGRKTVQKLQYQLSMLNLKSRAFRTILEALRQEALEKSNFILASSLPVKTGSKGWQAKYRLLVRLKDIIHPDRHDLPIGTVRRTGNDEGPLGGSAYHGSNFARFLVEFLRRIPDNSFAQTEPQAGDLIKRFNEEYRNRKAKGVSEPEF